MRRVLIVLFAFFLNIVGESKLPQSNWETKLISQLNFSQASFDNWSSGGENSYSYQLNLNLDINYKSGKRTWTNYYKAELGASKNEGQTIRKNTDTQKFVSRFSYSLTEVFSAYSALNLESQLLPGYDYSDNKRYEISSLGRPGFVIFSLGAQFERSNWLKLRGGAAFKHSVLNDLTKIFDDMDLLMRIDKKKRTENSFGLELGADLNLAIQDNILYTSKLEVFNQGIFSEDDLKNTDVNWDHVVTASINKFLNVNFNFRLLYDRDISPKRQLKQVLAIGLVFQLF